MTCPQCEWAGLKSRVFPRGAMKTMLYCQPFYDEDGEYHHHDRNRVTSDYECSNKHRWVETRKSSPCPNEKCPFGKEEE